MENAYLLEVIRSLTDQEREELPGFVQSPYFNRSKQSAQIPALLQIILGAAPDFSESLPDKRGLYDLVFPRQEFIEGKLDKVMAELNKLVRTFLLIRHYLGEQNEFQQAFDLAGILRQRGLTARYKQTISKLAKYQENKVSRSAGHYYQQFQLEFEMHDWQSIFNQKKKTSTCPRSFKASTSSISFTGWNCSTAFCSSKKSPGSTCRKPSTWLWKRATCPFAT